MALAQRFCTLPPDQADPADLLTGERMLGTSLYYLGDLMNARRHLDHVLSHCAYSIRRSHIIRFRIRPSRGRTKHSREGRLAARDFRIRPCAWLSSILTMLALSIA